jgi:hypothetical protein
VRVDVRPLAVAGALAATTALGLVMSVEIGRAHV